MPGDWDNPYVSHEFLEEYGGSRMINNPSLREVDQDFTPGVYDTTYLDMELALPHDGTEEVQFGCIVKHLRNNGMPIGTANDSQPNPG